MHDSSIGSNTLTFLAVYEATTTVRMKPAQRKNIIVPNKLPPRHRVPFLQMSIFMWGSIEVSKWRTLMLGRVLTVSRSVIADRFEIALRRGLIYWLVSDHIHPRLRNDYLRRGRERETESVCGMPWVLMYERSKWFRVAYIGFCRALLFLQ